MTRAALRFMSGVIATALVVSGVDAAPAAGRIASRSGLQLTQLQEREIYLDLAPRAGGSLAPAGFRAKAGETAPASIAIVPIPLSTIRLVPSLRTYAYATLYQFGMAGNEIVIVDPTSRMIVDVITPLEALGASAG